MSSVISDVLSGIGQVASQAWDSVKTFAGNAGAWVSGLFQWGETADAALSASQAASQAGQAAREGIVQAFAGADEELQQVFSETIQLFDAAVAGLDLEVSQLEQNITGYFSSMQEASNASLKGIISSIDEWRGKITGFLDQLKQSFDDFDTNVGSIWGRISKSVSDNAASASSSADGSFQQIKTSLAGWQILGSKRECYRVF